MRQPQLHINGVFFNVFTFVFTFVNKNHGISFSARQSRNHNDPDVENTQRDDFNAAVEFPSPRMHDPNGMSNTTKTIENVFTIHEDDIIDNIKLLFKKRKHI